MSDLFWLTDAQMARLAPYFPKSHGKPRVDDQRVLSGIIFINRNGLRWRDAPKEYGPHKTLYNRWKRWSDKGIFAPMMPWSGLSLTPVKHAYEMGTSELHRTSIMLAAAALTTNRSMYPKDLSLKPRQKPGRSPKTSKEPLRRINWFAENGLTETPPLPKS